MISADNGDEPPRPGKLGHFFNIMAIFLGNDTGEMFGMRIIF